MKKAESKANTEVEIAAEAARRTVVEQQFRSSVIASIRARRKNNRLECCLSNAVEQYGYTINYAYTSVARGTQGQ